MHYKVGQLVVNRKLGLGKVLEVSRDNVLVYFRDQAVNPRTINIAAAAMELAADQNDPAFADLDNIERMKRPTKKKAGVKAKRVSRRSTHVPAQEEVTAPQE
jgi:hypothetical protein